MDKFQKLINVGVCLIRTLEYVLDIHFSTYYNLINTPCTKNLYQVRVQETWKFFFLTYIQLCVTIQQILYDCFTSIIL